MRRVLCAAVALCLAGAAGEARGATGRATLALEHDDNPFEQRQGRRAAWVSRLYVYLVSPLLERERAAVVLQHQWGLKRFWQAERASQGRGDVLASHLELAGTVRVHPRLLARWVGDLKTKDAQRLSSEESYLRGGLRLGLEGQLDEHLGAHLEVSQSGDDARDLRQVDVSVREAAAALIYRRDRRLSARLDYRRHWLGYDRPALGRSPGGGTPVELDVDQEDHGQEWAAQVQHYGEGLVQAAYSFLDNESNSAGYAYHAHTARLVLTRGLAAGVDGQIFATGQRRRYDHPVPTGALVQPSDVQDEYEQALLAVKLARRLAEAYDLSCEYRFSRNGSRREAGSYRKNVFTLAVDAGI
ncbi:MAG: hypothetical protein AB1505_34955 [Candidatus Latescibacterota bacterium]